QANMIRKPKIIFTPGDKLRAMIEKVSLERIGKEQETPEGGGSDRPEIE
ncbi:DNA-binding protein, partial [Parabacteroides goldsteinii]